MHSASILERTSWMKSPDCPDQMGGSNIISEGFEGSFEPWITLCSTRFRAINATSRFARASEATEGDLAHSAKQTAELFRSGNLLSKSDHRTVTVPFVWKYVTISTLWICMLLRLDRRLAAAEPQSVIGVTVELLGKQRATFAKLLATCQACPDFGLASLKEVQERVSTSCRSMPVQSSRVKS